MAHVTISQNGVYFLSASLLMSTGLKLTVFEYDVMVEKGAFDDLTQKIELIYGEISAMNPAGPVHDHLIEYLTNWSVRNTDSDRIRVRVQSGLSLPEVDSRPEPDVMWVQADHPRDRHPISSEALLVIEVSYSSLRVDRATKAALYAEAGISEYWIVNVSDELVHIYRDPSAAGYRSMTTAAVGQTAIPLAEPKAVLDLCDLFGH